MFIEENQNGLIYMRSDVIGAKHAFTTRFGGVSGGEFAALNLGSNRGDEPEAVRENFRRVCALFGVDENGACVTNQVHKNEVRIVTAADKHACLGPVPYEADFPRGNNSGFDNCWYKGGTHYNRPYLAHYSAYGGNVLNLESEYGLYDSSYSYLAMPIMREPLDSLYLRCTFGNRENTMTVTSAVAVGVMSDPEDFSTFVGIDTIDLHDYDTYSTYYYEKNLAGYGQYGSHVAFVAITPQLYGDTYTQNYVLISKVSLMKANNCSFIDRLRVNPGATSITVDWIDRGNASSWLVEIPEYYPCTDTTISIVVQDTHVVI